MDMRSLLIGVLMLAPASAQDDWDKVVLLQKVKRHIAESVKRLPDYTCLQTSVRYRRKEGEERERRIDTLVLDVLLSGDKELYASPGAKGFDADAPAAFTGHGLTGTGSFGLFLRTLFINDNGMFQYRGEERVRGRRLLKWDYRVPITSSGYTIRSASVMGTVGMRGSILIDPQTLDLVYLSVMASEIPPTLPLVSVTQTVDYALTRIGDRDVMLPQSASMKMVDDSGAYSRNTVEFTHCQAFRVESTLSFTAPAEGPASVSLPKEEVRPIPEGLVITVELAAPVTAQYTVGTAIEGRIAADVRDGRRIVLEAGSAVRGRIRRLEPDLQYLHNQPMELWVVGLEFTELLTAAGPVRFYANSVQVDSQGGAAVSLRQKQITMRGSETEIASLPELAGVAHFYVPALPLPKGFKTVWKTASPRSANR